MQQQQKPVSSADNRPPQRRGMPLKPADRIMLKAVCDNLSHLRRNPAPMTTKVQNGLTSRPDTGATGPGFEHSPPPSVSSAGNRLDYNKKAMSEIRQDLQSYHVPCMSQSTANGYNSTAGSDNMVRQVVLMGVDEEVARQAVVMSSSRNVDKVWEVAERLTSRDPRNGTSSRLFLPAGSKVLRKPSFEEKYQYRTGSPAGSDVTASGSRSDSPNQPAWDIQSNNLSAGQHSMYMESYDLQNGCRPGFVYHSSVEQVSVAQMPMSSSAPIAARFTTAVNRSRTTAMLSGRPVSGPPRMVPNGVYKSNAPLPAGGTQIAAAVPLQLAQPSYATTPLERPVSSNMQRSVVGSNQMLVSAAPTISVTVQSKPVSAYSTKQPAIILQQVRSTEVTWPSAQKATAPLRVVYHDGMQDAAAAARDTPSPYVISSNADYSRMTPVTVVSSTVSFGLPSDVSLRDFVNQSPMSQLSSGSSTLSTANSSDVAPPPPLPDKPPPPYPGPRAPIVNLPTLRQVPPPPDSQSLGDDVGGVNGDAEECQRIESPKPIRRAEDRRRDVDRGETKLRHFSPQAFRFFMEQHIENVLKMHVQRLNRRAQLETEMSQCELSEETQYQIRRMLAQKESNYLRLRRAKMDRSMFERVATLGTGAFGEVDLVRKRDTGVLFALKTLRKGDVLRRNQVAHVKAERDILSEADNEWVVRLYYSFQDGSNLYFVMDYIPGGDLMGLLIKLGIFTHELAQFYIAELVLAIESVHSMGFIHRDIKPDNILIDRDGHIRLTDFGLCTGFRWTHNSKYYQNGNHPRQDSMEPEGGWSECDVNGAPAMHHQDLIKPLVRRKLRHQRDLAHSLVGTPNYIAPEVLARSGYTACCDWWSVGVILYEMRVGQPPFLATSAAETQRKVINWPNTLRIPHDAELSSETVDLILRLCCDASDRLGRVPGGAADLKAHPFFAGVRFDTLRRQRAPYIPPLRYATDTSNFDPVEPLDRSARRSASLDSLLTPSSPADGGAAVPSCEGGRHAFLEFTFRRFFDDDGHAHATRITDPDSGQAPVYV